MFAAKANKLEFLHQYLISIQKWNYSAATGKLQPWSDLYWSIIRYAISEPRRFINTPIGLLDKIENSFSFPSVWPWSRCRDKRATKLRFNGDLIFVQHFCSKLFNKKSRELFRENERSILCITLFNQKLIWFYFYDSYCFRYCDVIKWTVLYSALSIWTGMFIKSLGCMIITRCIFTWIYYFYSSNI